MHFLEISSGLGHFLFLLLQGILLGAFLGLQREMEVQKEPIVYRFMGLRTMTLLAFLGVISTFFPTFPFLPLIFFASVTLLLGISHAYGSFRLEHIGLTTEFSALLTFWIGVLVGFDQPLLALLITIFLAALGAYRDPLHAFARTLEKREWLGAFELLVLSGAVLPFLPQTAIDPWGVFVPFNVWLLILLISGIGFAGYFLVKYLGSRGGIPLMSFFGAIVSSTAVTLSLAIQSRTIRRSNLISCGIMIAIGMMMLRLIFLMFVLGQPHLRSFAVLFIMSGVSFLNGYFFFRVSEEKSTLQKIFSKRSEQSSFQKIKSPFEIFPALKFGALFVLILFALYFGKKYFGENGVYVTSFFTGLVDSDPVMLSSLQAEKTGGMSLALAENAILIAAAMNTLVKIFYMAILGSREAAKRIAIAIGIVLLVGAGVYALI